MAWRNPQRTQRRSYPSSRWVGERRYCGSWHCRTRLARWGVPAAGATARADCWQLLLPPALFGVALQVTLMQRANASAAAPPADGTAAAVVDGSAAPEPGVTFVPVSESQYCTTKEEAAVKCSMCAQGAGGCRSVWGQVSASEGVGTRHKSAARCCAASSARCPAWSLRASQPAAATTPCPSSTPQGLSGRRHDRCLGAGRAALPWV